MAIQNNRTMSAVDWAMLLSLSILWGGSFFFNGVIARELPPFTAVVGRVALAAIALFGVMKLIGIAVPKGRAVWLAFFGMGFLNNVIPFSLIVWGQTYIASGLAAILNATTPIFTVIVAHILTQDEKLTRGKIFGVFFGFAGVAIMIGPEIFSGLGKNLLAQLAVVAAALSYGFAGIFGRRFKEMEINPIASAAGQVTASTIILTPLALMADRPWQMAMPANDTILALIGLALLSTALAYVLFFRILASAGATNVMLVTLLVPVSAILLGVFVLDEQLHAQHFWGMACIAMGLAAIDGRMLAMLNIRRESKRAPEAP